MQGQTVNKHSAAVGGESSNAAKATGFLFLNTGNRKRTHNARYSKP